MPETVYACTHVEKTACVDHYEKGCETSFNTIMCESANVTADSLAGLVEAIGKRYCLDIDDVWAPPPDDDDESLGTARIGYNRLETVDGDEPDDHDTEEWKAGRLTLYLCDYHFEIEKRTVGPVPHHEFADAGIKTHE